MSYGIIALTEKRTSSEGRGGSWGWCQHLMSTYIQAAGSLQVPQFVRTAVCYSALINIMCLL